MQKNMDKIQFESRTEIDEILDALVTFMKEHQDARGMETVKRLSVLLDEMYMTW